MQNKQRHQKEVRAFLQKQLRKVHWDFALPKGSGNETYFARAGEQTYFFKLGVQISRYQAMAALSLTPQILASGNLADGTSIIVQPYIAGRRPTLQDYHTRLEQFATAIRKTHLSPEVKQALPPASSELYSVVGLAALTRIQQTWSSYRAQVPGLAGFVDESLAYLAGQVHRFPGKGLVASHNDICNANWLISSDGRLYLIDLESMSRDDPALDIGATLWWYYPPALRPRFLEITGYTQEDEFQVRMRVRMAMHCLNITLPRENSFDSFDPSTFAQSLTDFRAILTGEENPQGYED